MEAGRLDAIIDRHIGDEGPLLPILHDVQAAFGHVSAETEAAIAARLNLSRAEACKARGVEAMVPAATTAAGERVRLSTTYCLGLCSVGPAARVGDHVHARLDEAGLVSLIERA